MKIRIEGFDFGHRIYWDEDVWRYEDNGAPIESEDRKCPHCEKHRTEEGHDPCIANLPGVEHACCGHGVDQGYVQFENGITIRGDFTKIENDGQIQEVFSDEALTRK